MDLSRRIEFVLDTIELNFEINTYDLPLSDSLINNAVLLDFMESFDVADIFTIKLD